MQIIFAQIPVFRNPRDPKAPWKRFRNHLAEDFTRHVRGNNLSEDLAVMRACHIIASKLNTMAIEGEVLVFGWNYTTWTTLRPMKMTKAWNF